MGRASMSKASQPAFANRPATPRGMCFINILVKPKLGTDLWRPDPESNRGARICNPLRHHSAIGPERGRELLRFAGKVNPKLRPALSAPVLVIYFHVADRSGRPVCRVKDAIGIN